MLAAMHWLFTATLIIVLALAFMTGRALGRDHWTVAGSRKCKGAKGPGWRIARRDRQSRGHLPCRIGLCTVLS